MQHHNGVYTAKNRDTKSIRRRFFRLHKTGPPTGDPNCPEHVRWAKRIQKEIYKKSEMCTDSEEESTDTDTNDHDDDSDGEEAKDEEKESNPPPTITQASTSSEVSPTTRRTSPRSKVIPISYKDTQKKLKRAASSSASYSR